jgi:putative ABC transport system permease protein
MRLSNIFHLYRVRLPQRLVQELLAVAGIAVGVALVFASLVANTSLTGSLRQMTSGIVGESRVQLMARGPDGFSGELLTGVRALSGVADAAAVLETRVIVHGPDGQRPLLLVGGDPGFASFGGPLLRPFASERLAGQRAIGLTAPVAQAVGVSFGGDLELETGAGRVETTLAGRLDAGDIGNLVHSPVAIAPIAYVQEISGLPGRVSRIFVEPLPGREGDVRRGLQRLAGGTLTVADADADVATFRQASTPTSQSTALFSLLAALVGFLFALSAVLLTVPKRRRFIADLRLAGHTPAVVVKVMLFDALMLGAAGALIGLLAGDQLSRHLFSSVPGYLGFAFPVGSQRIVDWQSFAMAIGAGLVAACIAVLAPIREIFTRRPNERATAPRRPRRASAAFAAGGAACLCGAGLVLLVAPAAAIGGMVLMTAALLLLLPLLMRAGVAALAWAGQFVRSAVPALAAMELRSRASRTRMFALAATGAVAVFASVAIGGAHRDLLRGLDASARQVDANADVWATFPGAPNAFATTPFDVDAADLRRIAAVPGVAAVREYHGGFLDLGDRRAWVLGPPDDVAAPIPSRQLVEGNVEQATARMRDGGWITLSRAVADDADVGVGDWFELAAPNPLRLRVAALSTNLGWPPGAIVLNAADAARAWGSDRPSALQITTEPDAEPATVRRALADAIGRSLPVELETAQEREQRHFAAARAGLERLTQISALVLGAAILAMATAMGGVIWQRRPTLAGLKADGFSQPELWRALLLESGILLGSGCFAGAIFGLGGQVMLSRSLRAVTGFPVFYEPALLIAAAMLAIVLLVATAILAIPGLLAVRVGPAPATAR